MFDLNDAATSLTSTGAADTHDLRDAAYPTTDRATPAATRREHDSLGEVDVPANAYWGIHTWRALQAYPISGQQVGAHADLVRALALVKKAAACANRDLGEIPADKAEAIIWACDHLLSGAHHDQFPVDLIQGGAGTSTNMNANEVIANIALEHLGLPLGRYDVIHPIDHVNASQSTNDAYPTALRLATSFAIGRLIHAMAGLRASFSRKADEFSDVIKLGRTQLQDAVPMTLGQEFSTYATMIDEDESRLAEARTLIEEVNLGGTAIGTGINTDCRYRKLAISYLTQFSGLPLTTAVNAIEATQDVGAFVQLSGVLKRVAVKLSKTCNDLRLLSSGPQCGFNEIRLPAQAAGSSIMPGKVNPVIPEVVNQIAFEIIGHDLTITLAAEGGQLQLNAFEPIIAKSLLEGFAHLTAGCQVLAERCVDGIEANRELLAAQVARSAGLATALNPVIGYEAAAQIAKLAVSTGRTVADLVREAGLLDEARLAQALDPRNLVHPRPVKTA